MYELLEPTLVVFYTAIQYPRGVKDRKRLIYHALENKRGEVDATKQVDGWCPYFKANGVRYISCLILSPFLPSKAASVASSFACFRDDARASLLKSRRM